MKITKFSPKYAEEMAQLFVDVYSEPGYEWDIKTAKAYLERDYKYFPEFCLMALNGKEEIMGAIFCSIDPYYKSMMLFTDSIQVFEKHRRKGIAKRLLAKVLEKAKEKGFYGVHMLADERPNFPKGWYERLGFEKTHWVEYECRMKDLELDILN
jgi:GNAT superfamily N-acetyltransferase